MALANINWYPGHMKKTKETIKENLKIIDVVLEVVDARIPITSKNPEISEWSKNKKRILLLNKSDLVSKEEIEYWREYFIEKGMADEVLEISAITGFNIKKIYTLIDKLSKDKKEKLKKKGLRNISIRVLVAGIPNVGKSKLINTLVKKKATGVGNTPGFTKGKQWVRLKEGLELLDTPGILWPKFESEEVGLRLAISGAIRDTILDIEEIASEFIKRLVVSPKKYVLTEKYKLTEEQLADNPVMVLEHIARNLNMILKGDKADTLKAAYLLLRDYRACKLGTFGLDNLVPPTENLD